MQAQMSKIVTLENGKVKTSLTGYDLLNVKLLLDSALYPV